MHLQSISISTRISTRPTVTDIPGVWRENKNLLKREDGLGVQSLRDVDVGQLGPGLGIRGRVVEKSIQRLDGFRYPANGSKESDSALRNGLPSSLALIADDNGFQFCTHDIRVVRSQHCLVLHQQLH